MRIHVNDLWPRKVEGSAQVPYLYSEDHNLLLNYITLCNVKPIKDYYDVDDENLLTFKQVIKKGRNMTNVETTVTNAQIAEAAVTADELLAADAYGFTADGHKLEDLIKEDFVQEDPADGVVLN